VPKALFLITDAGGGHRASAQALLAAAKARHPDWDLRVVNVYREVWQKAEPLGRWTGVYGEDLYNYVLKKSWLGLAGPMRRMARFSAGLPNPRALSDGVAFLKAEKPDLVVSLMPFVNDLHAEVCAQAGVPLALVMTDLVDTRPFMWYTPKACAQAAWVSAPCAEARAQAEEAGAKRILDSGLLLHPKYLDPALHGLDRQAAQARFGLDPSRFTVLVSMGGYGGKAMEDLVAGLDSVGQDWQIIAICGRNEELKARLEKRGSKRHKVVAVGFTQELERWLRAADLMVGKPGPASVFEAVACQVPLVLDAAAAMPQEEPNAALAESYGVALRVAKRKDLPAAVAALAADPERLNAMRKAQVSFPLPDAGNVITQALQDVFQRN
jgi:UDP-N-acetylglucosamine:LPS N-acetylglucosamine transferase